jgi:hypothetical protein
MKIFSDAAKKVVRTYTNLRLSEQAAAEVWVSQDGRRTTIEEMEPTHAKHIVAKLLRELEDGKCAYMSKDGRVVYAPLMEGLVDDEKAFIDDAGKLRLTDWRGL